MSYKKNAVSYGIWALYLMGIGIVLSFMGMVVGGQNTGVPYMAFVLLALVFGVLFLVYYAAKKLVDNVQIRKMTSGRTALIEGITVAVLLVAGLVLRLALLGSAWEEAAYYEVAKVTEEGMRVQLVQGSVYYYLCLLNLLFRLVGNKWMAGIILQIVLQMLGIVLAYFAVKRLSGRARPWCLCFLTVGSRSCQRQDSLFPQNAVFLHIFVNSADHCAVSVEEHPPRRKSPHLVVGVGVRRTGSLCRVYGYCGLYSGYSSVRAAGVKAGTAGDAAVGGPVHVVHAGYGGDVLPAGASGQRYERHHL